MLNPISVPTTFETDLGATVEGRFSPEDWRAIRRHAEGLFGRLARPHGELSADEAWREVIRDFHRGKYWGFAPNYRRPKVPKPASFGISSLWMAFSSMTVTKVLILWRGQIYSRSDDPADKWIFFACLAFWVLNFVLFLWRYRAYKSE